MKARRLIARAWTTLIPMWVYKTVKDPKMISKINKKTRPCTKRVNLTAWEDMYVRVWMSGLAYDWLYIRMEVLSVQSGMEKWGERWWSIHKPQPTFNLTIIQPTVPVVTPKLPYLFSSPSVFPALSHPLREFRLTGFYFAVICCMSCRFQFLLLWYSEVLGFRLLFPIFSFPLLLSPLSDIS